jgi:hypothetical protein
MKSDLRCLALCLVLCKLIFFKVQMLLEEGVAPKDIGVIAPYNAQVCYFLFVASAILIRNASLGSASAFTFCIKMHCPCAVVCVGSDID